MAQRMKNLKNEINGIQQEEIAQDHVKEEEEEEDVEGKATIDNAQGKHVASKYSDMNSAIEVIQEMEDCEDSFSNSDDESGQQSKTTSH